MKTSESREPNLTAPLRSRKHAAAGGRHRLSWPSTSSSSPCGWARFFGGLKLTAILLLTFLLRQVDYTLAIHCLHLARKVDLHPGFSPRRGERCDCDPVGAALGMWAWHVFLCGAAFISVPADIFLLVRTLHVSVRALSRPYLPYLCALRHCLHRAGRSHCLARQICCILRLRRRPLGGLPAARHSYVWTTPACYIQAAVATLTSAMRARVLGWSNKR